MLRRSNRRRRHPGQEGQVLVMALAFIAFVSIVATAVLRYADVTQLQHTETGKTASTHAPSEGAGLYAFVDSSRPDAPACAANGGGTLTFASGETLKYNVANNGCTFTSGNPGSSGSPCTVCITGAYPGASNVLDLNRAETVVGEVDLNGAAQLKNTGSLCVKATAAAATCNGSVVVHNGSWSGTLVSPTTLKTSTTALVDPYAGIYPAPDVRNGSSQVAGTWQPGAYSTLSGNIGPGTYVVTGTLGPVTLVDPLLKGATIYLACLSSGQPATAWRSCSTAGEVGGGIDLNNTTLTITAPTAGVYSNLAIFSDPNNTATVSETGQGQVNAVGNIYVPRMLWNLRGNGATLANGRLIVGAVTAQVGNNDAALGVSGTIPTGDTCRVYSDTLSETVNGTATSSQGHVVFQTACNGGNQMVSFDYQP